MEEKYVKDFTKFLKDSWYLFIVLFLAPIIVITTFVILEYIQKKIDMSAGEWASLLSGCFTYWGTVILGAIAVWQNKKVMFLNQRVLEMEEIKERQEHWPDIRIHNLYIIADKTYTSKRVLNPSYRGIEDWCYKFETDCSKENVEVVVELQNTSKTEIFKLEYNGYKYLGKKGYGDSRVLQEGIKPGEIFSIDYTFNKGKCMEHEFDLRYENIYMHRFSNELTCTIAQVDNSCTVCIRLYEQKYMSFRE